MRYQVPQHIDKNKIFIVNLSEIEGRLDPSIYKCAFKFISNIYPNVRLSDVAYINPKVSFNNMRNGDFISFIPMENIDEQNGEIVKCDSLRVQETKGYVKFIENDLLWAKITPCMQNGKSAIARNLINGVGCGSTEFYIIRPKNKAVLIEYIHFLLHSNKILETAKNYFGGSAGQQRVPSSFLEHFSTPLPPLEVQKDIVKQIKIAKKLKKDKDKEAQLLLDSIDDYLLKELGITIPKVKNDINNRMFIIHKKDLIGRYTPSIYKNAVSLRSELYDNIQLSHVAYINPNTKFPQNSKEMQISFVPMESVNETYAEIENYKNCTVDDSKGFTRFQEGDLLWAKITPCMENGKSSIAKNLTNGYGCGSTEFHVIRPKNNSIMVEFIHFILHMKSVRETAKLYFGGSAGQQRVASDFLEKMNVPLPPIDKQQEIVDCISTMRNKAKRLQEEGKVILENAKRKVERIIIGDDNI